MKYLKLDYNIRLRDHKKLFLSFLKIFDFPFTKYDWKEVIKTNRWGNSFNVTYDFAMSDYLFINEYKTNDEPRKGITTYLFDILWNFYVYHMLSTNKFKFSNENENEKIKQRTKEVFEMLRDQAGIKTRFPTEESFEHFIETYNENNN